MDKTTDQLLTFTLGLGRRDLPPAAVDAALARLLNCIGVSIAALEAPPVRIARTLAPRVTGDASARLFGTLTRTTSEMAAFVNGAMTRFLDMSDTRVMAAVSHPADALPGLIAVALIDGEITPATFDAERYRDPDVLALMGRSEIKLNEEFATLAPDIRCCRITATLSDGGTATVEKRLGPEDDLEGMSRQALEAKFHAITRPFLDDAARSALIDLVRRLEDLDRIGPLLDHTAVKVSGPK